MQFMRIILKPLDFGYHGIYGQKVKIGDFLPRQEIYWFGGVLRICTYMADVDSWLLQWMVKSEFE